RVPRIRRAGDSCRAWPPLANHCRSPPRHPLLALPHCMLGAQMRWDIRIAGEDTAQPRNLAKRVALVLRVIGVRELPILGRGCGAGHSVAAPASHGERTYGGEFLETKIEAARRLGLAGRIIKADLERLPFASESFDAVMFNEVLEHVPDDGRALAEAHRV